VSSAGAGPVESAPGPADLLEVLAAAQDRGFIGGGDLDPHINQAEAFAAVVERLDDERVMTGRSAVGGAVGGVAAGPVLDLGSGGGLPGLVLAMRWPERRLTLLDGGTQRGRFLEEGVARLGVTGRVSVVVARAEEAGHRPDLRGGFGVVVARSFGSPAVVAECSAPFLALGGVLVVSEPPESDGARWDHPEALADLGLSAEAVVVQGAHRFQVLRATAPCPPRFPRRTGVPSKRPLF
jgi:16S rRNA (guanine527-N7)-methyltransferase